MNTSEEIQNRIPNNRKKKNILLMGLLGLFGGVAISGLILGALAYAGKTTPSHDEIVLSSSTDTITWNDAGAASNEIKIFADYNEPASEWADWSLSGTCDDKTITTDLTAFEFLKDTNESNDVREVMILRWDYRWFFNDDHSESATYGGYVTATANDGQKKQSINIRVINPNVTIAGEEYKNVIGDGTVGPTSGDNIPPTSPFNWRFINNRGQIQVATYLSGANPTPLDYEKEFGELIHTKTYADFSEDPTWDTNEQNYIKANFDCRDIALMIIGDALNSLGAQSGAHGEYIDLSIQYIEEGTSDNVGKFYVSYIENIGETNALGEDLNWGWVQSQPVGSGTYNQFGYCTVDKLTWVKQSWLSDPDQLYGAGYYSAGLLADSGNKFNHWEYQAGSWGKGSGVNELEFYAGVSTTSTYKLYDWIVSNCYPPIFVIN